MRFGSAPVGLVKQTICPIAGFPLQNAFPVFVSWTAPNDGQVHRFLINGGVHVTVAETGGLIGVNFTLPDGFATNTNIFAGGAGPGNQGMFDGFLTPIAPGSTVQIQQYTALTAGAATLWAEIWGS